MTTVLTDPYLEGNFAPIRSENTASNLVVIGDLPTDLCGLFVRNGPNPQFSPRGPYHWFDGDGMLHGVYLSNGSAQYRNRYVQTQGWKLEQEIGSALWTGLMSPPQIDNPYGPSKNTANTALVWHSGRLLALWEGGNPHELKVPGLETVGPYTYGKQLKTAFTAHPKVDAVTGEMMFFGYSPAKPPYLHYSVVSAQGKLLRTVPIDLPVGVVMHDFAITEHYTLFMDLPLTFRPERMQRGSALLFESDRPSRFGLLPRHGDGSSIRWFETPACYVFHTLNAYEQGEEVILIGCRMSSVTMFSSSDNGGERDSDIPQMYRWRFNISTGAVVEERLDDIPSEFPCINNQYLGRPIRYGYTARIAPRSMPLFDGIIKYDLFTGGSQTHKFGRGRYGGEGVFVPRLGATAEDDGWLLTFVYDELEGRSELVVVMAQDITAEPVARIMIPYRVPYGFHGTWIAQAQMPE